MNSPIYLQESHRTSNEPKIHPLVRNSFVFAPTAGMRLAPEILVLELMREIFFKNFSEKRKAEDLDPDKTDDEHNYNMIEAERAVLYALCGRRKKAKSSSTRAFFAPAYPSLARSAWLRKNEARVVSNFLLGGPIAQHLWHKGEDVQQKQIEQNEIAQEIRDALLGAHSYFGKASDEPRGKELLSVALGKDAFSNSFGESDEDSVKRLVKKTCWSASVMRIEKDDELSCCITHDTRALMRLERRIPRLQWLQVFMAFLRTSLPVWLLAQMRITSLLHGWILDAVEKKTILSTETISKGIAERNKSLLRPTVTATRELFERIESYMKHRIELNIFLYCIEQVQPEHQLEKKKLAVEVTKEGDRLGIYDLLKIACESASDIKGTEYFNSVANDLSIATFLTREGERFSAWRNPLKHGQGKNIDEFFRVLYKAETGDELGGYLLTPEGRGSTRGFRVFPGQLLLKTVAFLAAEYKDSSCGDGGSGKLVLQDVEDHFARYGVDFSIAASVRPLLMQQLQTMGLLTGSPDAGSSVAVARPYDKLTVNT